MEHERKEWHERRDTMMNSFKGGAALTLVLLFSPVALPANVASPENGREVEQSAPSTTEASRAAEHENKRTVESLYRACQAEEAAATSWCSAYLMGVADTMSVFDSHKGGLCGATYGIEQLGPIFMEYAQAHQDLKDIDMLVGAMLAFRQVWPCS